MMEEKDGTAEQRNDGMVDTQYSTMPGFHHSIILPFHSSRRLCFGPTDAGRMILRGVGFIALAALLVPAFDVLCVLVCVMLMALVVGFLLRPRVLVTGRLPDRIVAGQTAHLTYAIKNLGRLPAYHLRVRFRALPDAIEQTSEAQALWRLGSGQTAEVTVAIRPSRRGAYRISPPVCESSFPFNLFYFGSQRRDEESLVVLPAFWRLDFALPYVSRHVNASSLRPAGRTGISPEYIGNRPYQPGDPLRRIDVRAWARLSVPVTKEYDDDLDNYAALILDTRVAERASKSPLAGATHGTPLLEAAVSLCASVAYTLDQDCLIDLLLAGTDLHRFTSVPKAMRLDRIHETLAVVEPSAEYDAEQIGPLLEDRLSEISEVIFIVLRWDGTYQRLVELAEQAGCHCTALVVDRGDRDPKRDKIALGNPTPWSPDAGGAATGEGPQMRHVAFGNPVGPSSDLRFVSADEILAGRTEPL